MDTADLNSNEIDEIKVFNPNVLTLRPGVINFIGASHSGKTLMAANILTQHFIPLPNTVFLVYSENDITLKRWENLFSANSRKIVKIKKQGLENTLRVIERKQSEYVNITKSEPIPNFVLILDDIVGSIDDGKELKYKRKLLNFLMYQSRHLNLWVFILIQEITVLHSRVLSSAMCNITFLENSYTVIENHLYPKIFSSGVSDIPRLSDVRSRVGRVMYFHTLNHQLKPFEALVFFKNSKNMKIGVYKYLV
jgi:hypothetical protein